MIAAMQLSALASNFGWQLIGADCAVESVSIDSRDLAKDSLFVALRGDQFDGHDYLGQVETAGASAVLVESKANVSLPQLVCADSRKALASLAQFNVQQFDHPIINVTGSAGKTTTKSILGHILNTQAPTLVTEGNFNNEIGVPLTGLAIAPQHRFAVIEMGAARLGDIAYLCNYITPNIALVTNAGDAHIEGFGSAQGIAQGKGEIYEALTDHGTAIINADSVYRGYWRELAAPAKVIEFGCSDSADVYAQSIEYTLKGSVFKLCFEQKCCLVRLQIPGEHNVMNALAAAACSIAVGIPLEAIAAALTSFSGVGSRLSFTQGLQGSQIINDSYNANPSAFRAAIDVLAYAKGTKVLVMGAMAELGESSEQNHKDIARYAFEQGIDQLLAVGEETRVAATEFGSNARWYESKQDLVTALQEQIQAEQTILVKGSRVAGMETVVKAITANTETIVSMARGGSC